MRKFIPFLSLGLFAACVALSFSGLSSASACPGSNSASLTGQTFVYSGADRLFSYAKHAGWSTVGTPFIGAMSIVDASTFNVTVTNIDPLYFFPSACQNEDVQIVIQGTLDADETVGGIYLQVDLGPSPNNASAQGFTEIHYPGY